MSTSVISFYFDIHPPTKPRPLSSRRLLFFTILVLTVDEFAVLQFTEREKIKSTAATEAAAVARIMLLSGRVRKRERKKKKLVFLRCLSSFFFLRRQKTKKARKTHHQSHFRVLVSLSFPTFRDGARLRREVSRVARLERSRELQRARRASGVSGDVASVVVFVADVENDIAVVAGHATSTPLPVPSFASRAELGRRSFRKNNSHIKARPPLVGHGGGLVRDREARRRGSCSGGGSWRRRRRRRV